MEKQGRLTDRISRERRKRTRGVKGRRKERNYSTVLEFKNSMKPKKK